MAFVLEDVRTDLRLYLRDLPGLNNLLEDSTENSDDNLNQAITYGMMCFNTVVPYTNYSLANLPSNAYYFLINEAVIQVLISAGILEARNRLNYSNGGLTVADHDKAGPYQSWIQVLRQFSLQEKQYKMFNNIAACYGSVSSEFLSYTNSGWRILN